MPKQKINEKGLKKKKVFLLSTIWIILSIIITIIGIFLYFSKTIDRTSKPLYEEIYSETDVLTDKISRVDRLIYETLYREEVNENNIYFSEVIPRHKNEYDWDFTELLIRLPDTDAVHHLAGIISREIYKLKPTVSVKKEIYSQDQTVYHVYINNLYTHRIKLICKGVEQKKDRKVLPKVAIIIDDIGYDRELAVSFMDYDIPIVLSILPLAPYSLDIANAAKRKGCELLLHLPMEPKNYPRVNPGEGALLTDMDEKTIRQLVKKYVKMVPGVTGINNHMGSYFTERYDKMRYLLEEVKALDLFYVDSRTTKRTVAYKLAKSMGVPAAKKSVFLDNDITQEAIKLQIDRLLSIARYSGSAVGIGHPHRETLKVLREYVDLLKKDYKVVPVSELTN